MGAAPPWGQSLLLSCLAPHSFPPPPPAYVLSALGMSVTSIRLKANRLDSAAPTTASEMWEVKSVRKVGCSHLAKPHQAGVGAGRSAQRGTSGATTGPRGRAALP